MRHSYLIALCGTVLSLVLFSSCKKEKEEEKEYMFGSVKFDFPEYVVAGEKVSSFCSGVTDPSDVEYFWYSAKLLKDTIFSQSVQVVIPDTIGTVYISATARKDGYYSMSQNRQVTIINPDKKRGSLKGLSISKDSIIDIRDNNIYHYVPVGSLYWFSENLKYQGTEESPVGRPYYGANAVVPIFGNLYTWKDATNGESRTGLGNGPQGVCPQGWSVPTNQDWEDLAKAINGGVALPFEDQWDGLASKVTVEASFNNERMWPYHPDFTKENKVGWNAIPTGHSYDGYKGFRHLLQYGMWWSSTEKDYSYANYRYIYYNHDSFFPHGTEKNSMGVSVRCVKLIP